MITTISLAVRRRRRWSHRHLRRLHRRRRRRCCWSRRRDDGSVATPGVVVPMVKLVYGPHRYALVRRSDERDRLVFHSQSTDNLFSCDCIDFLYLFYNK